MEQRQGYFEDTQSRARLEREPAPASYQNRVSQGDGTEAATADSGAGWRLVSAKNWVLIVFDRGARLARLGRGLVEFHNALRIRFDRWSKVAARCVADQELQLRRLAPEGLEWLVNRPSDSPEAEVAAFREQLSRR